MVIKTTRPPDYVLLGLVAALTVFGLVMVYSSSWVIAFDEGQNQVYYLMRQSMWAVVGSVGLLIGLHLDYHIWRRLTLPILGATLALLVLVLILPDSMTKRGGAERWITFGPVGLQPTEVAKFSLIIYLASWLRGRGPKLRSMTISLIPFTLIMGVFLALVMLQPNLSTAIILGVIGVAVYFAAGANLAHIGAGLALGGSLGWFLMQSAAYRLDRVKVFQDPWSYAREGGFQPIHAMYALASGGLFGRGLGQSRQKFNWLPSAHADAIYSVIGEELGLVGTLAVLIAFLVFTYRGLRIATKSPDPFAALLAVGITSWLTFQAFVNMAVVAQVIPFTGVPLPFISYGGSSLAMCMFVTGVLLNISRHVDDQPPESVPAVAVKPQARKKRNFDILPGLAAAMRRWNRGPRVSSASRSFSFGRRVERAPSEKQVGWRRLSAGASRRSSGSGAKRDGRRTSTRKQDSGGGSWRRR
jgi:cell division protein FtsW